MTLAEGSITRLANTRANTTFEGIYESSRHTFVTTPDCSPRLADGITSILATSISDQWKQPLSTYTLRNLFLVDLSELDRSLPQIILKKSRFTGDKNPGSSVSVTQEIQANRKLRDIVSAMNIPPDVLDRHNLSGVSVAVEQPIGALFDKKTRERFTAFIFEEGFDSGERLKHHDDPIESDWKMYWAVSDVVDFVKVTAEKKGLVLEDYGCYQTLYRLNPNTRHLSLVLIDTERAILPLVA